MRDNPTNLDKAASEQSRAVRRFAEPDGWEADAKAEQAEDARIRELRDGLTAGTPVSAIHFDAPKAEVAAFRAGLEIGRRDERNRIKAGIVASLVANRWGYGETARADLVAQACIVADEIIEACSC